MQPASLDFQTAFDFTGQVALVTGAVGGIGKAMAEIFRERGIRLALVDRNPEVMTLAETLGGGARGWVTDINDEAVVIETVSAILSAFGRIDILVNNAGIGIVAPAEHTSLADWDRTMAINLRGQFLLSRTVAPHMLGANHGRIVIMSSQAAVIGIENHTAYSASKSGLLGMARCMAIEWGGRGVTVNTISPTVVNTEMSQVGWAGEKGVRARAEIPVGRFAEPREIALAALFLASGAAGMINGANLVIDGGYTIR